MKNINFIQPGNALLTRRKFVLGASAVAAISTLPLSNKALAAGHHIKQAPATLRGKTFDLHIKYDHVNFTGKQIRPREFHRQADLNQYHRRRRARPHFALERR